MRSWSDATLRLYLIDALEPWQRAELDAALSEHPALAARLTALSDGGWPPELDPPGPWRVPPPVSGPRGQAAAGGVLGEPGVRIGDVCRIRIAAPDDVAAREVVLLQLVEDEWVVVVPYAPDARVRAADLEREGARLCVDFLARPPAGTQRWAVALPLAPDLDASPPRLPDFASIQRQIMLGALPARAVDIEVDT